MVSQEPGLLTGSIADIIRYGQPAATDSEVEWAARAAQAHDFICELPQGYQVRLGKGGGKSPLATKDPSVPGLLGAAAQLDAAACLHTMSLDNVFSLLVDEW